MRFRRSLLPVSLCLLAVGLSLLGLLLGCQPTPHPALFGPLPATPDDIRWQAAEAACEASNGFWLAWRVGDRLRGRCVEMWRF